MSKASLEAQEKLRQSLLEDSEIDINYQALTVSACIIATMGLLSNSAAVIIGAMVIAPLMLPSSIRRLINLPASEFTPEKPAPNSPL
ncbi:MAG: hypothetical protein N3E45_14825 [Oscillatoriaceae bacterium SKW80]|nr:hypothetical protein [Oscillatoriaceae bacterium SKYG93]MCX8122072.1 hypothetical protein [Oscillatoriaceae bacterium SKW80]MDW8454359.1 hypothetical protein [Oscillatoriaceae cyanobacterium SKYGB_i_bin93]